MAGNKRSGFGLVEDTTRIGTTINPRNRAPMNHLPANRSRPVKDGSDRGGYPIDQTARSATVFGGRVNKDGSDRGSSLVRAYAAQRRRAGSKGY